MHYCTTRRNNNKIVNTSHANFTGYFCVAPETQLTHIYNTFNNFHPTLKFTLFELFCFDFCINLLKMFLMLCASVLKLIVLWLLLCVNIYEFLDCCNYCHFEVFLYYCSYVYDLFLRYHF